MEELVAELGSAFLCGDLGLSVTPRPDHACYLASWLKVLKGDNRAIFTAASAAAKAAEWLGYKSASALSFVQARSESAFQMKPGHLWDGR